MAQRRATSATSTERGHLLRRVRPHAAARRAGRAVPGRRRAPPGVRAVHGPRAARGLDPRVRRRRARAAAARATRAAGAASTACARGASARAEVADARGRAGGRRGGRALRQPARAAVRSAAAGAAAQPRHVRAVPTNAELKMERALDVFNASEHPRTVAGVARTLGAPGASRCVRWPTGRASWPSRSCGSCPGTASRSTCPTRRERRARARATAPSSTSCRAGRRGAGGRSPRPDEQRTACSVAAPTG